MTKKHRFAITIGLLGLMTTGVFGCAARLSRKTAATTPPERPTQTEAAIQRFEQGRDRGEFEAARACWKRGDSPGCQGRLELLLARSPEHEEARLLMAQMLWATDRSQEAAAHLQRLVAMRPDNARAQHGLGRVLESGGQVAVAVACYERAARLEPENEAYLASYRKAVIAARNPVAASERSAEVVQGADSASAEAANVSSRSGLLR